MNPGRTEKRNRWLPGILTVGTLMAGGRWISHVPVGPAYIGDLLLFASVLHGLCAALTRKATERTYGPGVLLALVVLFAAFRLLTTDADADMRTAARDAAPFLYCCAGYLSSSAYQWAGEESRKRAVRMLYGALLVHLVWVGAVLLAGDAMPGMPQLDAETRVFDLRPDFDAAMLGVLIGLSILRVRTGKGRLNVVVAASALFLVFSMHTRAGLLACFACIAAAFVLRPKAAGRRPVRSVLLGCAVVLGVLLLLPGSSAGQRFVATTGGVTTSQEAALSAEGTTRARMIAWRSVIGYTLDDPGRTAIGVGFGTDFLRLSDADVPLGRGMGVRSPHNYLLTCFARLGLAGLSLVTALLASVLGAVARALRSREADELTSLCVLLVVSLLVVALLGVVLESPFGAVPFFWASGVLLGRKRLLRARRRRIHQGPAEFVQEGELAASRGPGVPDVKPLRECMR
ncbi:O-antigen ligase family protein [Streptomyces sp. R39]|uniref:O-antigen ligase family protein n=1 Tax=Streptomyces sp. R39 TaxID=3238631 RepID=A0AB39QV80_9ACTN